MRMIGLALITCIVALGCAKSTSGTISSASLTDSKSPAQLSATYSPSPTYYLNAALIGAASVNGSFTTAGRQFQVQFGSTVGIANGAFNFTGNEVDTVDTISYAQQRSFTYAAAFQTTALVSPYVAYELFLAGSGVTDIRWEKNAANDYRLIIHSAGGRQWQYRTTTSPSGTIALIVSVSPTGAAVVVNGVDVSSQLFYAAGTDTQNAAVAQFSDGSLDGKLYEAAFMPLVSTSDAQSLNCYLTKTYGLTVPTTCL